MAFPAAVIEYATGEAAVCCLADAVKCGRFRASKSINWNKLIKGGLLFYYIGCFQGSSRSPECIKGGPPSGSDGPLFILLSGETDV